LFFWIVLQNIAPCLDLFLYGLSLNEIWLLDEEICGVLDT
jgi:hypothetical protein